MANITDYDRAQLVAAAVAARQKAYAPYSKFSVGAAVLGTDGKIYTGCNVENASYGLTMCAERTAMFKMVSEGCTKFAAMAVVAGEKATDGAPCGACRQVMCELANNIAEAEVLLAALNGGYITETVASLMPYPFTDF
ncbi:MAG: cytidine deaminase [Oscillospiraceae bacterium]|nr:cytidine deaminase [Oscillospiraceae bacterium]MBQ7816448.1 cytidine deaminase [Oscillospiraceae bacterium]